VNRIDPLLLDDEIFHVFCNSNETIYPAVTIILSFLTRFLQIESPKLSELVFMFHLKNQLNKTKSFIMF